MQSRQVERMDEGVYGLNLPSAWGTGGVPMRYMFAAAIAYPLSRYLQ